MVGVHHVGITVHDLDRSNIHETKRVLEERGDTFASALAPGHTERIDDGG